MNNVIIGTAGHVDHGKTCLIRALTGAETDRLKEEKKRGITIELGFAEMPNSIGRQIGIIDVPGHEKFVRNMLAGIGGIDLVLLVVAADEGVMPQTVEHFEILKMLGIKKGMVVITKKDLVDPDWLALVHEEIEETIEGTFLEGAPITAVSSHTGEGIDKLRNLIFENLEDVENRKDDPSLLRIPVDRVFTMEGFGTVITGTLLEGSISTGSEVQIYPGGKIVKVRNIQVHGSMVDSAYAGQRTAVNLINVKKSEIKRGDVIAAKASLIQAMMVDVKIQMFDDAKRVLENGSRLHLYYGSAEALCKAILLDKETLRSGEAGYAQLRMEEEIAVRKGDRFIIRFYSPVETIGGGVIIDASPVKHKRFRKEVIESLAVKEAGEDVQVLEQVLLEMSRSLPTRKDLAIKLGCTEEEVARGIKKLEDNNKAIDLLNGTYVHGQAMQYIEDTSLNIVSEFLGKNPVSLGISKEEFRRRLADSLYLQDVKATEGLLRHLVKVGFIEDTGSLITSPGHKVKYSPDHIEIINKVESLYLNAGFDIPELSDVLKHWKDKDIVRQLIESMAYEGKLKKLTYQYFMHIDCWNKAVKSLMQHMEEHGDITLAEYRDILGTSRKYAVLILEHLDEQKITRMEGEARVLLK